MTLLLGAFNTLTQNVYIWKQIAKDFLLLLLTECWDSLRFGEGRGRAAVVNPTPGTWVVVQHTTKHQYNNLPLINRLGSENDRPLSL